MKLDANYESGMELGEELFRDIDESFFLIITCTIIKILD